MVSLLLIDDEKNVRDFFIELFGDTYEVYTAESGKKGLEIIGQKSPDITLLDIIMPEMDGLETLKNINVRYPNQMVIMLTAVNEVETAVKSMKLGAFDYICKPFEINDIRLTVDKAIEFLKLKNEVKYLKEEYNRNYIYDKIIGTSEPIQEIFDMVNKVAKKDVTVLIEGETGTGKELIARSIHKNSKRCDNIFVGVDCSSIPDTLIESEMFGYEKGAFTGAYEKKIGKIEFADKGTLFLDEIGNLKRDTQVKLLRVLQEQEIYRLGNKKPIKIDVRIIAATHLNLEKEVDEKRFRDDLYYRLNVIKIKVPPLRERKEDIPLLTDFFLEKYAKKFCCPPKKLHPESLKKLMEYRWSGNIRELQNVIERSMVLAEDKKSITPDIIQIENTRKDFDSLNIPVGLTFKEAQSEFEKYYLTKVLQSCDYNRKKTSELLNIDRSYVSKLIYKNNIVVK